MTVSKEYDILHTSTMPVIALRGLTVFPSVLIHFEIAREASVKALEAAMNAGSPVFLVGQRDIAVEEPELNDLYQVGTISNIRQILRMPGDNVRVMVEGVSRGRLLQLLRNEPHLEGEVQEISIADPPARSSAKIEALMRSTYELFQDYAELARQRREAVDAYTELYDKAVQARTVCQGAQAAYEAVEATAKANLDQILSQVRAFRPMVRDLADARAATPTAATELTPYTESDRRMTLLRGS